LEWLPGRREDVFLVYGFLFMVKETLLQVEQMPNMQDKKLNTFPSSRLPGNIIK
jgi:hypothetical protein